ncbi:MAG: hypothetical protein V3S69_05305 [Dehalococcoidales bacterium]
MSGNNLMGDANQDQAPAEVTGEDALKLLVGEGQKYATVEELAKAAVNGQAHIQTLEKETAELRDNANKAASMEEVLKAIRDGGHVPSGDNNVADQSPANTDEKPLDIEALLEQKLSERDSVNIATSNTQKVQDALAAKFGNRAAEVYRKAGQDNNCDLDQLAKTSPQAVINLVSGQPTSSSSQSLNGGHQVPEAEVDVNLTKASINKRYAAGEIDRDTKTKLEFEGFTQLGSSRFYGR